MTPYEQTMLDWAKRPRDRPLEWYENKHKSFGFLFATPAFYIMGRPVPKAADPARILNVEHVFDFDECDCWYLFQLTGRIDLAWDIMPWELRWMCWKRETDSAEHLRFYETRTLKRLSGRFG